MLSYINSGSKCRLRCERASFLFMLMVGRVLMLKFLTNLWRLTAFNSLIRLQGHVLSLRRVKLKAETSVWAIQTPQSNFYCLAWVNSGVINSLVVFDVFLQLHEQIIAPYCRFFSVVKRPTFVLVNIADKLWNRSMSNCHKPPYLWASLLLRCEVSYFLLGNIYHPTSIS